MAKTLEWRGDAQGVAQVDIVTFTEIEQGDTYTVTINRKDVVVTMATTTANPTQQDLLDSLVGQLVGAIGQFDHAYYAEFREVSASAQYDDATGLIITGLRLTGLRSGKPFTLAIVAGDAGNLDVQVVEVVEGDAGQNETQRIIIPGVATGGTFTITFDGQTTAGAIAYNATAATVESGLESLSNITAGDVVVSGAAGGPWDVEFKATYALTDVALMTCDGANLTKDAAGYTVNVLRIANGTAPVQQQQEVTPSDLPSGGTFTLTFQGQTTAAIQHDATGPDVVTALEALSNIAAGEVSVTKLGSANFIVAFGGQWAGLDVELMTATSSLTPGSLTVTTIADGSPGNNNIHQWTEPLGAYRFQVAHPFTEEVAYTEYMNPLTTNFSPAFSSIPWLTSGDFIISVHSTVAGRRTMRIEWRGQFAGWDVGFYAATGISSTAVTTVQNADRLATNEVQMVQVWADGGTFTLTFNGQTTAALDYDYTAAEVQTQLRLLSTIGSDGCVVSGNPAGPWTVTFSGALAGQNINQMTGSGASLTGLTLQVAKVVVALPGVNDVQEVSIFGNPKGGTFTLTGVGGTTGNIAYNATALAVETALELLTYTDVEVTGADGGPWLLTFKGDKLHTYVPLHTGNSALLSGVDVSVDVVDAAVAAVDEQQSVTLLGSPTGGTFTLTYDSQETGNIAYNASAVSVQSALELLSNIAPGDVLVTGVAGGPWTVLFAGTLAATDVDEMTGDPANLTATGTQTAALANSVAPTGPNHFDEAENWHNPAAPGTASAPADGDSLYYRDSNVSCLWGLETNSGDTFAAVHVEASYTGAIGLAVRNDDYFEYRPTALACGITSLIVGEGEGPGSALLRFDLESVVAAVEVYRTGSSTTDLPSMIIKGGAATSTLSVYRGDVGVAVERSADTATIETLIIGYVESQDRDASVWLGDGVGTVALIDKSGGQLRVDDSIITSLIQTGGETVIAGNEVVTSAKIYSGELYCEGSNTFTSLLVGSDAVADFSRVQRSRTVTDCTVYSGATIQDSHSTVTWTNGISYDRCGFPDTSIDIGVHKDITITDGA
jgi:hypothetical protein